MKKSYLTCVAILLSVMFFAACGNGGSGSFSKNWKTNEYLGNIPAIAYEYQKTDSAIKMNKKIEMEKLKSEKSIDKAIEKAQKLELKTEVQLHENKTKMQEAVAKEEKALLGKSVPFEITTSEFEISELKITEVHGGGVITEGTLTVKEKIPALYTSRFDCRYKYLNTAGEIIGRNHTTSVLIGTKLGALTYAQPGEKYDIKIPISVIGEKYSDIEPGCVDFAKVVFISEKEYYGKE